MSVANGNGERSLVDDPLYLRIQDTLRGRIRQGVWLPGQTLPSRRQLCSEFGTTHVTLGKAIGGLVREGLLRATRGSGTFVAQEQKSTVTRTLRVGVVIKRSDVDEALTEHWDENFYFGPLFQGIRDGFGGEPVEIIHARIQRGDYESYYRGSALDGMILVLPHLSDLHSLQALTLAGVPYVAAGFSTDDPADSALPCVDTDNCQGAFDAVNHLLKLGHRRIAVINLATAHANHHDRLEGYRRALAAAGATVTPDDLVLYPTYTVARFDQQIEAWMARVKESGSLPTAIFTCDYIMTLATLRVLRRHHLTVPDDISVVGFDDPVSAEHLTPALTTVRQPVYAVGLAAAKRLQGVLQGGPATPPLQGREMLPNQLVIRASTAPPRTISVAELLLRQSR